ncbi:MAG: hypothetical protein NC926_01005 [Candidatus Omnitrophica bacterium]|nr:hypothetical protein [Candidatus Omnitrophota bacterium]
MFQDGLFQEVGLSILGDGVNIIYRRPKPIFKPEGKNWPEVEGIKDPRINKIRDTYYLHYLCHYKFYMDKIVFGTTKNFNKI